MDDFFHANLTRQNPSSRDEKRDETVGCAWWFEEIWWNHLNHFLDLFGPGVIGKSHHKQDNLPENMVVIYHRKDQQKSPLVGFIMDEEDFPSIHHHLVQLQHRACVVQAAVRQIERPVWWHHHFHRRLQTQAGPNVATLQFQALLIVIALEGETTDPLSLTEHVRKICAHILGVHQRQFQIFSFGCLQDQLLIKHHTTCIDCCRLPPSTSRPPAFSAASWGCCVQGLALLHLTQELSSHSSVSLLKIQHEICWTVSFEEILVVSLVKNLPSWELSDTTSRSQKMIPLFFPLQREISTCLFSPPGVAFFRDTSQQKILPLCLQVPQLATVQHMRDVIP